MEQTSSAFSTGVPASAAIPQLAGNSRQGFGPVDGTMHWASGWVISSNTLGIKGSLYDGDAGSRSTGKERDAESGNDYFNARYYGSSMGRMLSPDPLYLEMHRLVDPQQLNLYVYGRNNPLRYTVSTGLDVNLDCSKVSADACNKTVGDLNGRKDAQFSVSRNDKTGLLQVDGKVDTSKLSSSEAALYGAITDTDHHATLSVVSESADVQFGRFDGNGHNTLDRSDLNLLGNVSQQAVGQVIAHEALEAYDSSFLPASMDFGSAYGIAHGYATQFFGEGETTAPVPILNSNPAAFTQNWTLTGLGSSFTVKTVPVTPQPDYNKPGFIPGKMVDIWPTVQ